MGIAVIIAVAVGFFIYRSIQSARVTRVRSWVKDFLVGRYGNLPEELSIYCTDDQRWPVLVEFCLPHSPTRHRLQFMCSGITSKYRLVSEKAVAHAPRL